MTKTERPAILVTQARGRVFDRYFPSVALDRLAELGTVRLNESGTPFTSETLADALSEVDICVTHWDAPVFTDDVLRDAPRLRLIGHAAGTVARIVTEEVYERGIAVSSANAVMARVVAEGALAYMLLGLGTVGRFLLELLVPFGVDVLVYDPYVDAESIARFPQARLSSLEEALSRADVVSVHAARTSQTRHLLDATKLGLLRDGALLVNTARGAIIDEAALTSELASGRLHAVIDVFDSEPLDPTSALRHIPNAVLLPHRAAGPVAHEMTMTIADEIERFVRGEPLRFPIGREQFRLMTR